MIIKVLTFLGIIKLLEKEGWISPADNAIRENTIATERYKELDLLLFNREAVILALDTLACALTNYNHAWSEEDRHIYEQALISLGIEVSHERE